MTATSNYEYDSSINNSDLINSAQHSFEPSRPFDNLISKNDTRTQLFVGNLPFRVRWQDLKDLMRKVGTVLRADVALSQPDGRSRGFGVVLFAHAEDAYKAVEIYNGFSWQTRILDVRLDSQDPTGAIAIAEANRQTAVTQQVQSYQLATIQNQQYNQSQQQHSYSHLHQDQYQTQQVPLHGIPWPASIPPPPSSMSSSFLPHQYNLQQSQSPNLSPIAGAGIQGSNYSLPPSTVSSPYITPVQTLNPITKSEMSPSPIQNSTPTTSLPNSPTRSQFDTSTNGNLPLSMPSPRLISTSILQPPTSPIRSHQSQSQHSRSQSQSHLIQQASSKYSEYQSSSQQQQNYQLNNVGVGGYQNYGGVNGMRSSNQGYQQQGQQHFIPPPPPPPTSTGMQNGGLMQFYQGQQRNSLTGPLTSSSMSNMNMNNGNNNNINSFTPTPPPSPPNRHIFVGNLPFNLQWQELKDLMRQSGTVLRADIAQGPDGRSRGFGSVLFSSPQDADRAVQMFNGYDYNGRALKVHFDKFSTSPGGSSGINSNSLQPYSPQIQNQHPGFTYDNGYRDSRSSNSHNRSQSQNQQSQRENQNPIESNYHQRQQSTISSYHEIPPQSISVPISPPADDIYEQYSPTRFSNSPLHVMNETEPPSPDSEKDEEETLGIKATSIITAIDVVNPSSVPSESTSLTLPSTTRSQISPPKRIAMPPAYHSFGPFSPGTSQQFSRPSPGGLMTPGMPAFTLGAFPQTPPLYPSFFSPGLGPFSPGGIVNGNGGNYFANGNGGNGFINAAPGAPIHRTSSYGANKNNKGNKSNSNNYINYNPMFGNSNQQQQQRQYQSNNFLYNGNNNNYQNETRGPTSPPITMINSNSTSNTTNSISNDEPSYFPDVSTIIREDSTLAVNDSGVENVNSISRSSSSVFDSDSSPITATPLPPVNDRVVDNGKGMKLLSEGMQSIQFSTSTIPPTPPINSIHSHHSNHHHTSSTSSNPNNNNNNGINSVLVVPRRKSFVAVNSASSSNNLNSNSLLDIRRRFEGNNSSNYLGGDEIINKNFNGSLEGVNAVGRRASFEDSGFLRSRPSFGSSSIWATASVSDKGE